MQDHSEASPERIAGRLSPRVLETARTDSLTERASKAPIGVDQVLTLQEKRLSIFTSALRTRWRSSEVP